MTVETIIVAIIVACCGVFSAWRLMSIKLRLKTLDALSMLPGIANLRRKTLAKLSTGGGCGTCQAATKTFNANVRSANRKPAAPHR
jgi:hypothetical protein